MSFSGAQALADARLRAALVTVDITPPIGVPLAGYGARRELDPLGKNVYAHFLKPSTGVLDPIYAKILLLERGSDRLAFIAYDLIGGSAMLRHDLAEDLAIFGYREEQIFVSGTHTHSGAGSFAKNWIWEIAATDRFRQDIYDGILRQTWSGLITAMMTLQPAWLSTYSFDAQGLQKNRRGHPGRFDPRANVLLVQDSTGAVLGGMANLAVHGTSLGADNLLFSADAPGAMRARFEEELGRLNRPRGPRRPTVLFLNGSEGDVAPALSGTDGMRELGDSFAEQAIRALVAARPLEPRWSISHAKVKLGHPGFGIKACLDGKFPILQILGRGVMPLAWTAFPDETEISAIHLDDLLFMTWPGEATTQAGLELKRAGRASGSSEPWVLGLTNDHLAYFTMPDEYAEGKYEGCASLYGAQGAVRVIDGYRQLLGLQQ